MEQLQESQAAAAALWTPVVLCFALAILRWRYAALAAALQGKRVLEAKAVQPTVFAPAKLYRYERQIGEGGRGGGARGRPLLVGVDRGESARSSVLRDQEGRGQLAGRV